MIQGPRLHITVPPLSSPIRIGRGWVARETGEGSCPQRHECPLRSSVDVESSQAWYISRDAGKTTFKERKIVSKMTTGLSQTSPQHSAHALNNICLNSCCPALRTMSLKLENRPLQRIMVPYAIPYIDKY